MGRPCGTGIVPSSHGHLTGAAPRISPARHGRSHLYGTENLTGAVPPRSRYIVYHDVDAVPPLISGFLLGHVDDILAGTGLVHEQILIQEHAGLQVQEFHRSLGLAISIPSAHLDYTPAPLL